MLQGEQLDIYLALLQKLDLHHQQLRHRQIYSLSQYLDGCHLERRDLWRKYGQALFQYLEPLPGNARCNFVRWIEIGGECFLLLGQNSLTGSFISVKIAKACFNTADVINESESGIFFKSKERNVIQNEFRKRFFYGIETQRKAYKLLKSNFFNIAGVPNVVALSKNAPVYSLLEWVDGETFSSFVRNNYSARDSKATKKIALTFWRILRLFKVLHSWGIVHRDVKPQNIIINYRDLKPYLIDFSLTKEITDTERSVNTADETYLGDILYSPPEQIYTGHSALAKSKSDVYSLGWFLYFMHTRKSPPRNIQKKLLRTSERNEMPGVFRNLFIAATRENMDSRPDIEDFIRQVEDIYHAEGIYFDDDLFREFGGDDNAKTKRTVATNGAGSGAVQSKDVKLMERVQKLEYKIDLIAKVLSAEFKAEESKETLIEKEEEEK